MRRDINFFSSYQGKKKEKKNKNIYIASLLGFLAIFIVGTLTWNTFNILKTEKQIKEYQAQLEDPAIKEKVAEAEEVSAELDILSRYDKEITNVYKSVTTRDIVSNEILNMVSSTLPTEVSFNSLNVTNTEITMQATSTNRTAIAEVQYNLKQLRNIQEVYIGSIAGDEKYTFDIRCTLKDGE